MKDRFGRPVKGMRISVTKRCNLKCFYCHAEGHRGKADEMTADEIGKIVSAARDFGVSKVKITGGEPLMRDDLAEIVRDVSSAGVREISMSTNGVMLADRAEELAKAGLTRVNISLDTLNGETYRKITGAPLLDQVLRGINAAIDAGLSPVKLNMVIMKDLNDKELERMIDFSAQHKAILQLIELLKTPETAKFYDGAHFDLGGIEAKLERRATKVETRNSMHARRKYFLNRGEVEIVNPMHNREFCAHCTRLRLTPNGFLKPCLLRKDNLVDVISPIRRGDSEGARKAFEEAIARREPFFKGGK